MVGAAGLANEARVERLRSGHGPVLVNLVLDVHADVVGVADTGGAANLGLLGELVVHAAADDDGLALNTLEVLAVAVEGLKGVADAFSQLLVATEHQPAAGHVHAGPVEGVLVVLGLVDELGPDLLDGLGVGLEGDTEVDLVGDLNVDGGLDRDGALLVVVSLGLHAE